MIRVARPLSLAALACASPAWHDLPDLPDPPLEQVVVELDGGVRIEVAGAWLDRADEGRGVTALATAPGDPPIQVRADRTEWRLKGGELTFLGGVRLQRGELVLVAARLDVTLREGQVVGAVASGGVRVTEGEREGTAPTVVLDLDRRTLELRDAATLRQGGQRMRGARITLDLDREEIACDACEVVIDPPAGDRGERPASEDRGAASR